MRRDKLPPQHTPGLCETQTAKPPPAPCDAGLGLKSLQPLNPARHAVCQEGTLRRGRGGGVSMRLSLTAKVMER